MPKPPVDLKAYFERIGYSGSREASLETLNALIAAQVQNIPFENLDALLRREISLDLPSIEKKLLQDHRGGSCLELNPYFAGILEELGFSVRLVGSRVRWQTPPGFIPPRTHVFPLVELDNDSWLVDIGLGDIGLACAIRLEPDAEQGTPLEPRRIIREGAKYVHQLRLGHAWYDVCDFTLEEMTPTDCEVAMWFYTTHPDSKFLKHLLVSRLDSDGGRLTLFDNKFSVRDATRGKKKRILTSREEVLCVLAEHFGIHLGSEDRLTLPNAAWLA